MKKDIENRADIQVLIDCFYAKLAKDDLLKIIFYNRLGETHTWQKHLDKIYDFWESILFAAPVYIGQSFLPHFSMNLYQHQFDRWLFLFNESVHENFAGTKATEAMQKANTMAVLFMSKINHYRTKGGEPLV